MDDYSTQEISEVLLEEIKQAVSGKDFGSVEIYIENSRVSQITERVIRKTIKSDRNDKKKEFVYWKPIKNRK